MLLPDNTYVIMNSKEFSQMKKRTRKYLYMDFTKGKFMVSYISKELKNHSIKETYIAMKLAGFKACTLESATRLSRAFNNEDRYRHTYPMLGN